MKTEFRRLVRFRATDGSIKYGEAPEKVAAGDTVAIYLGDEPWNLHASEQTAEIVEILCPLATTNIFYGIGLNYKQHIAEAKMATPDYPTVFTKPPDALANPYEDIQVDSECRDLDYEGELCIIIGKDCRNFRINDDFAEYVLGYCAGNDVSARFWQMPAQSGNQHGYAKSFDHFGPIGPVIASTSEIPNPHALELTTTVNGEVRQKTSTGDLLFTIPQILVHLTRGTTVRKGTVIMTGTPSGVAAFMKPPRWLQTGDLVQVEIGQIGHISNRMVIS